MKTEKSDEEFVELPFMVKVAPDKYLDKEDIPPVPIYRRDSDGKLISFMDIMLGRAD